MTEDRLKQETMRKMAAAQYAANYQNISQRINSVTLNNEQDINQESIAEPASKIIKNKLSNKKP